MSWLEALILGLVQGLTEFLPVSSSGHLELGKALLGVNVSESLQFTVVVHGATVLSTIVVFWKDIVKLVQGCLKFKWNEELKFVLNIAISMVPVGIIGVLFKDEVKSFFEEGNVRFVGYMLLCTSGILAFSYFKKSKERDITILDSLIIGIAQAFAVLPGISRSGSTIATGLIIGNKKEVIAKFSFLMVLIPILGENVLDLSSGEMTAEGGIGAIPLLVGFVAAFIAGLLACKWMINIVKRGKLIYFSIYCFIVGMLAIFLG